MQTVAEVLLDPEKSYEIINGQPEEKEMPGARHSGVCTRFSGKLGSFVEINALGEVYQEASF
jgi:Uma2 family endonuclease